MRYSDDYKEKIVNDYKHGMTAKEVMEKYSIKKSTLYDLLKVYRIKKHKEEQLGQVVRTCIYLTITQYLCKFVYLYERIL